jgi:CRISPR/Cas system-associated exonuclease Cas4 (RecB family)
MDIEAIYGAYLKQQELLRERDKNVFHASTAGSCYRKQLYSYYDFPSDEKDAKSYRILRLGTIVHKDVEEALIKYEDTLSQMQIKDAPVERHIHIEEKIEIKQLNVVGTFDSGERIIYKDKGIGTVEFNLYDLKTAAAYKWTTLFGRKENRKPKAADNYKMQLGTYALGIRHKYALDRINMYLIWYNKNTSHMREQLVSNEWIDNALKYWTELYEMNKDMEENFIDELVPEITLGVPFQDWECRYCQYYSICPSTIADKKPRFSINPKNFKER